MGLRLVECPSPNHDARPAGVDVLVLHYTGMKTAEEALARLCDPIAKVSAHYTVDRDGTLYAHVPEDRRAWHAGVSFWAGRRDLNGASIGIEIVNPGHEFGYVPFAAAQIAAVIALSQGILSRHPIPPSRVVGHSDIAPARKEDPGELFPWAELAGAGIGLWPFGDDSTSPLWGGRNCAAISGGGLDAARPPPEFASRIRPPHKGEVEWSASSFLHDLRRFGYGVSPEVDVPDEKVITAFQRHWRPERVDGIVDAECAYRLGLLLDALS